MFSRLPPLNALRAFEVAARHLSFKTAALELSVTPTAVSHQIKLLESFLGQPLFYRLTRALALTPQGKAMLPKVQEGLACFAAAAANAQERERKDRLIVVLPPSFATRWLVPRLRSLTLAEPALDLHVVRSLKTIDGGQTGGTASFDEIDPRPGDAVVVIRYGNGVYPGFQVDPMFGSDYIAVCSPKLLQADPALRVHDDMRFQVLLHDESTTSEHSGLGWDEWFRLAGVQGVDSQAGPRFSDSGMVYVAALDGLGVALASKPMVATALAQGRLVSPFDITVGQNHAYYLVVPEAVAKRSAVQSFRQWLLVEALAEKTSHMNA